MATLDEYNSRVAKQMLEKDLQEHVRRASLQVLAPVGGLYYHTHRSQHSPAGLPDVLVSFLSGHILAAELKRECLCRPGRARCTHHPSELQQAWLARLAANPMALIPPGAEVGVWRPSDYISGAIARFMADAAAAVRGHAKAS